MVPYYAYIQIRIKKKKKTFWIILILEIVRGKSALSSQRTTSQTISSKGARESTDCPCLDHEQSKQKCGAVWTIKINRHARMSINIPGQHESILSIHCIAKTSRNITINTSNNSSVFNAARHVSHRLESNWLVTISLSNPSFPNRTALRHSTQVTTAVCSILQVFLVLR